MSFRMQQSPASSMAAPQIPNLLTLRGGVRGGRGRRGGRSGGQVGGRASSLGVETVTFSEDEVQNEIDNRVQLTDLDASHSRLSAVGLGYLNDVYAPEFHRDAIPRRQPIINRGELISSVQSTYTDR